MTKTKLYFFQILLVPLFTFAQEVNLVKTLPVSTSSGIREYIKCLSNKGIIQISESEQNNVYNAIYYDLNLNQQWKDSLSLPSSVKKMGLYSVLGDDQSLSLYFYKKRNNGLIIGFFPASRLLEVKVDGQSKRSRYFSYPIKNYTLLTGITQYNNRTYLTGVEAYKPVTVQRVVRFTLPFLAGPLIINPLIDAGVFGAATVVSLVSYPGAIVTWFFPTAPKSRPSLVEIDSGKATYLNRSAFKSKYYRNKGIHDIFFAPDSTIYLGITNALNHAKNPIIIEKYDQKFTLLGSTQFLKTGKNRISAFHINSVSGDTLHFSGSYGNKIVSAIGTVRGGGKASNIQAFDGTVVWKDDNKIEVKNSPNVLRDQEVNEVYKTSFFTSVNSRKTTGIIDNQLIEVTIFETDIPDIEVRTVTTYTSKGSTSHDYIHLRGYFISHLRINIHNRTTGVFREYFADDFSLYEPPSRMTKTLMHSCVSFTSNNIVVSYIQSNDRLISYSYGINGQSPNQISLQDVSQAMKKGSINYSLESASANRFLLTTTLYKKKDENNTTVVKGERYSTVLSIYEAVER